MEAARGDAVTAGSQAMAGQPTRKLYCAVSRGIPIDARGRPRQRAIMGRGSVRHPAGEATPRVSVLMTTHNGAARLPASLDSVLAQRFRDFELVVVDDASTDATPALLATYAARDPRIRVLCPPDNLGVVGARNLGFAACRGDYVAPLDHDDLSRPERLAAQVAHLDAEPRVVVLGTGVLVETAGRLRPDPPQPCTPPLLRWALHVGNPFTWSSVMLRGAALRQLGTVLRPESEYADDFDLYHRLLALGDPARLAAPLTVYRWHDGNATQRHGGMLFARAARVLAAACRPWLGETAEADAALLLRHLSDRQPAPDLATLARLGMVLERVLEGFCADQPGLSATDRAGIAGAAAEAWWQAVRSTARSGRPGALRLAGSRPALRPVPARWTDRLASLAIGLARVRP
jgi:glycosyltransferase involved in cell wall biosynthesis